MGAGCLRRIVIKTATSVQRIYHSRPECQADPNLPRPQRRLNDNGIGHLISQVLFHSYLLQ